MEVIESCLLGVVEDENETVEGKLYRDGKFDQFLEDREVQALMGHWGRIQEQENDWGSALEANIKETLASADSKTVSLIHRVGVASLQLFVSVNWLGRNLVQSCNDLLPFLSSCPDLIQLEERVLVDDSDGLVSNVQHPECLIVAKMILVNCRSYFSS